MIVIQNETFQRLQQLDRATENERQRKQIKYSLLDRVANVLGRAFRNARKVAAVIDEIVYKATDRGYSFNGRETLAEKVGVSLRTVDNAIKLLKKSAEVLVAYRENPGSNGIKTPVIIFKNHPNFDRITHLLNLPNCEVVCEVENASEPTEPSVNEQKKIATYSLPSLKQENNNNIATKELLKKYADYKINDILNKDVTVKYISSYISKLFKSLETQSLYYANNQIKAKKKQLQEQANAWYKEAMGITSEPVPFYNWLES